MKLTDLFPHPVIQGPMAGGANTPAMVAAVSNAGGLGSIGASLLSPATLREQVAQIRTLTDKPFAINLFVQSTPDPAAEEIARAVEYLRPIWSEFGWETLPIPEKWCEDFETQFATLLDLKPCVASFTFHILSKAQVAVLHRHGIKVVGTATTVAESLAWQEVGADAVVASGVEAGGHRGTFLVLQTEARDSIWQLGPAVCNAVRIPVIFAGGIMHGRDIAKATEAGAQAVQMGTAFLVTDESGIHPAYKSKLLEAASRFSHAEHYCTRTCLTRSFSGRYARGIENRFMQVMEKVEHLVPAYPVQNALTGSIRAHAGKTGQTDWMSLWAGMGVQYARAMPCAQLLATLLQEWQAAK